MMAVIKTSRHFGVNPDNVATPIAASLGDLTTLLLLAAAASMLFTDLRRDRWLAPVVIAVYLLVIAPLCAFVARSNKHTEQVSEPIEHEYAIGVVCVFVDPGPMSLMLLSSRYAQYSDSKVF